MFFKSGVKESPYILNSFDHVWKTDFKLFIVSEHSFKVQKKRKKEVRKQTDSALPSLLKPDLRSWGC